MNKNIEKLLSEIGLRLKGNKSPEPDLETCLAYLDGNLNKHESERIENYLLANQDIYHLMEEVRRLKTTVKSVPPPRHLHEKLLDSLGYSDESIFDIVIQTIKGQLELIKGTEWLMPSPQAAFRNEENKIYRFHKSEGNYKFEWNGREKKGEFHARCQVSNLDNKGIKNIRFDLFSGEKIISSCITNESGFTNNLVFPQGIYHLKIYNKSEFIGKIEFTFSSQK